jgi:hypothetical protein
MVRPRATCNRCIVDSWAAHRRRCPNDLWSLETLALFLSTVAIFQQLVEGTVRLAFKEAGFFDLLLYGK